MSKYTVYAIPDYGDGIPVAWQTWDGESTLSIPVGMFSEKVVIEIERIRDEETDEQHPGTT